MSIGEEIEVAETFEPAAPNGAGPPNPRRALAPHLYREPRVHEAELARVIERSWQLAGHVNRVSEPGDYLTVQVGTQPVLVMRDRDGELRAFRNVCRHRGSRLLSGSGNCGKALRCRYHGWTYRHDGSLIGVPEKRGYEGRLEKSELGLLPARIEELCGLLFVNLDPMADDLAPQLGDLPERLGRYRIPELEPFSPYEGEQPVNWKIIIDNYLEGYHVPIAHPGSDAASMTTPRYDVELGDGYAWFEAPPTRQPVRRPPGAPLPPPRQADAGPRATRDGRVWRYFFIYPNTAIDLYPDQVMTWQINPDGPRRTRDVFMAYRAASPGPRTRAVQWLNAKLNWDVHKEDIDLVQNVQAGLETRGYEPGPLAAAGGRGRLVRRAHPRRPRPVRQGSGGRAVSASDAVADPARRAQRKRTARDRILDAAIDRIASDGIDGVRIARIAMDAGVSTSLVHYHFETREALLGEALEHSYERRRQRPDRGRRGGGPDAGRTPRRRDRRQPSLPGDARARLDPLGRALAARRAQPGAAGDLRAPLRADARVGPRRDRRRDRRRCVPPPCDPDAARRPRPGDDRRLRHPRPRRRPRRLARPRPRARSGGSSPPSSASTPRSRRGGSRSEK